MDMAKPKIRFNGYTEDWEQRKVLDLLIQPITDGPHETPKLVEEGVPFISVDAIVDNKIDFNRKRGNISEEYDELCCKKYKPQFHDVYLVKSGSTVGKVAIVETTDRFNIWSPLAAMRCGEKTYPYFLYDLLQTKDLQAQVADKASNGTQPNLSMRELEKFPVSVPSNLEEQKKIGDYFRNLDHLITLHQRKCEQTKTLKKYMLQKMFPQDGEKVPQIRFEGFTEDWEQRELSEIALQTYGGGTPKTANEEFWKGNIPWIQSSDLIEERLFNVKPRKYISQEAISKSSTKLVPQNSIAIVTRVGVGKLAFMPFSYATSQDFLSLSELKIEPKFAVYALYKMMRLVSNEVQGTSIKGITKDELLAKEILIPDCEEQKKIGAYLHNLDHLITLHQRKCDELKEVKKFMLQNMFV